MGFQRRRDGELCLSISIKDIDQLILLDGCYETSPAFRVTSQVLARYNSAHAGLAKGLEFLLLETILLGVILENGDSSGVSSEDNVV